MGTTRYYIRYPWDKVWTEVREISYWTALAIPTEGFGYLRIDR